jgi:catechol 2,3-dioxygenase-like lactoylglutathione lyase family enzyme
MSQKVRFKALVPQLVVPDVVKAAEFYCDKLGFELLGYFLDPPVYAMVRRDDVEIHFGKGDGDEISTNESVRRGLGHDIYIIVSDIEGVFRELTEAGVEVVEGPIKRLYGSIEVVAKDCFGFKIVFGD